MSHKITNHELREMPIADVLIKEEELRRELFQLELTVKTSYVKSFPSQRRQLKKAIAQCLTHVRQKMNESR